jgi:hypothetical protein
MSETTSDPYETRLNIHCQQGEVIDERALADACLQVVQPDFLTSERIGRSPCKFWNPLCTEKDTGVLEFPF